MNIHPLHRAEIPLVWQIGRREIVENIYYVNKAKKPEEHFGSVSEFVAALGR